MLNRRYCYFQQDDKFVPFIDAELYIDNQGVLHSRYYRKPQKKAITLNAKSHHLSSKKTEMVRNYYRTTETVSSGQEKLDYSFYMVDDLLRKNGYSNPRDHIKTYNKKKIKNVNRPILELPFISYWISNQIWSYTRKLKIQAHIVFKPGKKLRGQFCNSRPRDSWRCVVTNNKECTICPDTPNDTCSTKNLVYEITCKLCHKRYIGGNGEKFT